ncbi:MAG: thermonuclease family protein [Microthrixaceae bacterium]
MRGCSSTARRHGPEPARLLGRVSAVAMLSVIASCTDGHILVDHGPAPATSTTGTEVVAAPTTSPPSLSVPATTTTGVEVVTAPTTSPPSLSVPADDGYTAARSTVVVHVVDGDTVDIAAGGRVRLIGIDTPERGQCGYAESKHRVEELVAGGGTAIEAVSGRDDRDRYGRLLRYVLVDGRDVGTTLLSEGLAHARYDGLDGYGEHPRQAEYRRIDAATPDRCGTSPPTTRTAGPAPSGSEVYYENCAAARRADAAPIRRGQPGYRADMDGDGDGIACETPR